MLAARGRQREDFITPRPLISPSFSIQERMDSSFSTRGSGWKMWVPSIKVMSQLLFVGFVSQPSPQPHSHCTSLLPELPHLPAKLFPAPQHSCLPWNTTFPAYFWMLKPVLLPLTSAAQAHSCRESGCISHYPLKCFIAYVKALGSSEFGPNFRITIPLRGKWWDVIWKSH